MPIKDHHLL